MGGNNRDSRQQISERTAERAGNRIGREQWREKVTERAGNR
jgi:hypothetical protein